MHTFRKPAYCLCSNVHVFKTACKCSEIGTENQTTCAAYGGQCHCKPGVMGRMCDRCKPGNYNFTVDGCTRKLIAISSAYNNIH